MNDVVIVGAGHGAGQLVSTLLQKRYIGQITLIGEEPWYPYQRPPLSKKYLKSELSAERLFVKPKNFYSQAHVNTILNTRVTAIDRIKKLAVLSSGETIPYTKLVLATGSRPRLLDIPGIGLNGIHYLRNIHDADQIRTRMSAGKSMVVIGAGYIGLEVASVAVEQGLNVSVIEMQDRVMSRVVSPALSDFYRQIHFKNGVNLLFNTSAKAFSGRDKVDTIFLSSGEPLPADIVVIGIGILPNTELAAECGIETSNGIVVDEYCRTSDPNIYAIGDCTFHPNALLGYKLRLESVHNALEQAKTAANNICGETSAYAEIPWFWSDQYDLKLQICGLSTGYDQTVIRGDPDNNAFSCIYLRDKTIISIDAINRPRDFIQSKTLIAQKAQINLAKLADEEIQLKDMMR